MPMSCTPLRKKTATLSAAYPGMSMPKNSFCTTITNASVNDTKETDSPM